MIPVKTAKFILNPGNFKLHIKGYCSHTDPPSPNWLGFHTEDEALAYGGRAVGMCKICQKKRERGDISK